MKTGASNPNVSEPATLKTITVLVDSTEESFRVHKNMICGRSRFFEKACSGNWNEAKDQTVRLPEVKVECFQVYLDWAYSNKADLVVISRIRCEVEADTKASVMVINELLCDVWMLGNFLGDDQAKNDVVDALVDNQTTDEAFLTGQGIVDVATKSKVPSGLQQWMLDNLAQLINDAAANTIGDHLPQATLSELLKKIVADRGEKGRPKLPKSDKKCKYHEHDGGKKKCK